MTTRMSCGVCARRTPASRHSRAAAWGTSAGKGHLGGVDARGDPRLPHRRRAKVQGRHLTVQGLPGHRRCTEDIDLIHDIRARSATILEIPDADA